MIDPSFGTQALIGPARASMAVTVVLSGRINHGWFDLTPSLVTNGKFEIFSCLTGRDVINDSVPD
jgi:hypothetical protein